MKLDLASLGEAAHECTVSAAPEGIDLRPPDGFDVRFDRDVSARLSVRRVGEEFFIRGQVETAAVFTCVRCLREFEALHRAPLELIVHRVTTPQPGASDLETYVEVPLGTAQVDLSSYAREALLLAVPQAPRCREDCRGLCPQCGADLNAETCDCRVTPADPRWDALRRISSMEK